MSDPKLVGIWWGCFIGAIISVVFTIKPVFIENIVILLLSSFGISIFLFMIFYPVYYFLY